MTTTKNKIVLNQGKGREVTQEVYFRGGAMEIVTRDTSGTEIRTFHNFGNNQNGLGSTRIVLRGTTKTPTL